MRQRLGGLFVAGAMALAACSASSGVDVTSDSADVSSDAPSRDADDLSVDDGADDGVDDEADADGDGLPDIPIEAPPADDRDVPDDDDVRVGTLDNGLRYYVRSNDQPGAHLDVRLVVDAGSVNETDEQSGVAHFLEHMLFNGTEEFPENELVRVLRSFGAQFGADLNAYTSFDETVYSLTLPNDEESVELAIEILSEWLSAATIDPVEVERERGVVLDEWRVRTQGSAGRINDVYVETFLHDTAYEHRLPIGDADAISTMEADGLRSFYDGWYRPDNAAIVAVGDVDAGDLVGLIEDRFGQIEPRAEPPAAPDRTLPPADAPRADVHADPDVTSTSVEVALPLPVDDATGASAERSSLLDLLVFDALSRRLRADVSEGTAPFDDASTSNNDFVRGLDAPSIAVNGSADESDAAIDAVLTEFRRAQLHGFSQAELDVSTAWVRSLVQQQYDGRDSVSDGDYADTYAANFLEGEPFPAADDQYDLLTDLIDEVTVGQVNWRMRTRMQASQPHVVVVGPEGTDLPDSDSVLAAIDEVADSQPSRRADRAAIGDALMDAPDPVDEIDAESGLGNDQFIPFVDPDTLTFDNGATVTWNSTEIEEGLIRFSARSPGGMAVLPDDDVVDALWTPEVLFNSGVGAFDQIQLDEFLAGRTVSLAASIDPYYDELVGAVSTADVETLFQLIHLYMTEPRFDPVAFDNVVSTWGPIVADPTSDPGIARFDALLDTRYGGEPRFTYLPTVEEFDTLDLEGIERTWRERTSNVGDWAFVFSGDLEGDTMRDLSRTYLGTLPGDGSDDPRPDVTPAPPPGAETTAVNSGTGDTGSVSLLYDTAVDQLSVGDRVVGDLVGEIVTDRLTRTLREELGDSYSPSANVIFGDEPGPVISTFIEVTGAPDRLLPIAAVVQEVLSGLRGAGPTPEELDAAVSIFRDQYDLYSNDEIITELLGTLVAPERDLGWLANRAFILDGVTSGDVQAFVTEFAPTERYVQVVVEPS